MTKIFNLILDIDETIVKTIVPSNSNLLLLDEENVKQINIFNRKYLVFLRPKLNTFIEFCFTNFNVGFWTAGSPIYCNIILKMILNDDQFNNCNIILARDDENYINLKTNKIYKNITNTNVIRKPLNLLWEDDIFKYIFNPLNTIIIDDNPNVKNENPKNCILIKQFKKDAFDDDVLEKLIIFLFKFINNDDPNLQRILEVNSCYSQLV